MNAHGKDTAAANAVGGTSERGRGSGPPPRVEHPSREERVAHGKAARRAVPRESHAVFAPEARPDPISLLEEQARSRSPDLVPIRHGRMGVSPFTFYRGAALIMASDLATTPTSGLRVQLCGDAHLSNFGMFASPERHLVFDINDFDETSPGPWEWDVKRLAASLEVGGRDVGFTDKERRAAVLAGVRRYREAMQSFASQPNLAVWYAHLDVGEILPQIEAEQADPKRAKMLEKALEKMRTHDSAQVFSKLTEEVDGEPRIVSQPPIVVPLSELVGAEDAVRIREPILEAFRRYRRTLQPDRRHLLEQFRFVELAHKIVGVGSVGLRAWIALMLGPDGGDPLFLQIKEAEESVLERFVGKSPFANQGQRVVRGQRLMQATSDIFLGWDRFEGLDGKQRDYYFRQLKDWKGSVEVGSLQPKGLVIFARLCGWTLARAHARSGDRFAIASYLGRSVAFDEAIAEFSVTYADQNERDYEAFTEAIRSGRIEAREGV